ncbi:MAG: AMP phosphorylase [Candidatus Pacearchaeota archaeon]|jgi:AMP phosphorylase
MKLKVKHHKWSAGRPVAILNKEIAKILFAGLSERILIEYGSKRIVAVLDLSSKIAERGEIVLSTEILEYLNLSGGEIVNVEVAIKPRAIQVINKKLKGEKLKEKDIFSIVRSIVNNELSETEIAFFISAVYERGMSMDETAWLTKAMYKTGNKLGLKNKVIVDKHSIGGIAGNRTTPIVVSICAAAGLIMPKTSSRAITSAAGTADVLEAICDVNFSIAEIKKIVQKTNACMVWGGALGFAPADDKIIRVESAINIDPEPNLLASIMAKKLSVGSKFVLIDIPQGKYAKVDMKKAKRLSSEFEQIGRKFNIKVKCVITDGSQPIGNGIGPVMELRDIILILKNENGPKDLRKKSIFLAGQLFELCGKTKKSQGEKLAEEILSSGKAYEKFQQIIKAQKGSLSNSRLSIAKFSHEIKADKNCRISMIDNKKINLLGRIAGSPNDKKAGLYLHGHLGDNFSKGDKILTIYSQSKQKLSDAIDFYKENDIIEVR